MDITTNPHPTDTRLRLAPDVRAEEVLRVALDLAVKYDPDHITRAMIAAGAGVSPGTVSKYMGTMQQCREKLVEEAIKRQIVPLVAWGIFKRYRAARKVRGDLREKAEAYMKG